MRFYLVCVDACLRERTGIRVNQEESPNDSKMTRGKNKRQNGEEKGETKIEK